MLLAKERVLRGKAIAKGSLSGYRQLIGEFAISMG